MMELFTILVNGFFGFVFAKNRYSECMSMVLKICNVAELILYVILYAILCPLFLYISPNENS